MLYSDHKNIKDKIVETLVDGRYSAKQIHAIFTKHNESCSLQAIYDALKILINANVLIKNQQQYVVNQEWKKKVVQHLHSIPQEPVLQPGEQQKYMFYSTVQLDKFWKHTNAVLRQQHTEEPIFFYEPHEFWLYNLEQTESQEEFIQELTDESRSAYMLIGSETPLDIIYKKRFDKTFAIHLDKTAKYRTNEHITILNDLIIITKLPASVAQAIDDLYHSCENEVDLQKQVIPILSQKMKITVTIKNNKNLATRIRRRISKDLHVPLVERKQFKLF